MNHSLRATLAAFAILSSVPAGATDVLSPCAACHSLKAGENGVGPSLANVIGRRAGTAPGFRFSNALRASGIVWSTETLGRFLTDPQAAVPGNRMPFSGIGDAGARSAIIRKLGREGTGALP